MPAPAPARRRPDPTITLINVVFLMLTFFLIAGTVAPPLPAQVRLVRLADTAPLVPPDVLVLDAEGRILHNGLPADPAAHAAALSGARIARILPDRAAPARTLVALARDLRAAGASEVRILTERALP